MDNLEAQTSKLLGSCHMCGKCCEAIHIPYSPEEIAELSKKPGNIDALFVHDNWSPITKAEAHSINPHFAEMEKRGADYDKLGMYYYTCKQHDKETKLCKVHDVRPPVCSGYPWYGMKPRSDEPFYTMDCGYKVDVEDTWIYKEQK